MTLRAIFNNDVINFYLDDMRHAVSIAELCQIIINDNVHMRNGSRDLNIDRNFCILYDSIETNGRQPLIFKLPRETNNVHTLLLIVCDAISVYCICEGGTIVRDRISSIDIDNHEKVIHVRVLSMKRKRRREKGNININDF